MAKLTKSNRPRSAASGAKAKVKKAMAKEDRAMSAWQRADANGANTGKPATRRAYKNYTSAARKRASTARSVKSRLK